MVLFCFCFQFVSVFLCCYKVLAHNSLWGPRLPFISGCRLQVQIIEVNWQDLSLGFQKEFNKKHGFSKMTFAVVRFQGDHDIDHKKKKPSASESTSYSLWIFQGQEKLISLMAAVTWLIKCFMLKICNKSNVIQTLHELCGIISEMPCSFFHKLFISEESCSFTSFKCSNTSNCCKNTTYSRGTSFLSFRCEHLWESEDLPTYPVGRPSLWKCRLILEKLFHGEALLWLVNYSCTEIVTSWPSREDLT